MSIQVSKEELDKRKNAKLEACVLYSKFVRRTTLLEAEDIIIKNQGGLKNEIYRR